MTVDERLLIESIMKRYEEIEENLTHLWERITEMGQDLTELRLQVKILKN